MSSFMSMTEKWGTMRWYCTNGQFRPQSSPDADASVDDVDDAVEVSALVAVRVAAEDHGRPVLFQQRQDVLADVEIAAGRPSLSTRRVGRLMIIDEPPPGGLSRPAISTARRASCVAGCPA